MQAKPRYTIRRSADVVPVPCPCGQSTRIITAADGLGCSVHVTEIVDSVRHYHQAITEVYYIIEGSGKMDLDDATVDIEPGMVITLPPGTRHRVHSTTGIKSIVLALPAFDPSDEYFD